MPLPEEVMDRFSENQGITWSMAFFGVPVSQMTRQELIAIIRYQALMAQNQRDELARRTQFLLESK